MNCKNCRKYYSISESNASKPYDYCSSSCERRQGGSSSSGSSSCDDDDD